MNGVGVGNNAAAQKTFISISREEGRQRTGSQREHVDDRKENLLDGESQPEFAHSQAGDGVWAGSDDALSSHYLLLRLVVWRTARRPPSYQMRFRPILMRDCVEGERPWRPGPPWLTPRHRLACLTLSQKPSTVAL